MDAKTCSTCHELRPLQEFNRRATAPDGLQARCRSCSRAWYLLNRQEHIDNVAQRNVRTLARYRRALATHLQQGCVDCGEADLRVLDLDHRDERAKVANVTVLITTLASWARVEREIAKCDVRCANCHRRRTAERGRWWRHGVQERQETERAERAVQRLSRVLAPP